MCRFPRAGFGLQGLPERERDSRVTCFCFKTVSFTLVMLTERRPHFVSKESASHNLSHGTPDLSLCSTEAHMTISFPLDSEKTLWEGVTNVSQDSWGERPQIFMGSPRFKNKTNCSLQKNRTPPSLFSEAVCVEGRSVTGVSASSHRGLSTIHGVRTCLCGGVAAPVPPN